MSDILKVYTVYEKPSDYPDHFVVRVFSILAGKDPVADPEIYLKEDSFEQIYLKMERMGLIFLHRSPGDDPCIVGTFI